LGKAYTYLRVMDDGEFEPVGGAIGGGARKSWLEQALYLVVFLACVSTLIYKLVVEWK